MLMSGGQPKPLMASSIHSARHQSQIHTPLLAAGSSYPEQKPQPQVPTRITHNPLYSNLQPPHQMVPRGRPPLDHRVSFPTQPLITPITPKGILRRVSPPPPLPVAVSIVSNKSSIPTERSKHMRFDQQNIAEIHQYRVNQSYRRSPGCRNCCGFI